MTKRSAPEWIGKSPDTPIPARVKARLFERHSGKCHISGRKITAGEAWDCDHILALCNGGENRESNLAPALKASHRKKTANDVAVKAKSDRVRKKHLGIYETRSLINGSKKSRFKKKLDGTVVDRTTGEPV